MKRYELKQILDQKQLNNFFSLEGGFQMNFIAWERKVTYGRYTIVKEESKAI